MFESEATSEAGAANAPPSDPGPPVLPGGGGATFKWDIAYALLFCAGLPYFAWRRFVRGKDKEGWDQKFGRVADRPSNPKRIWVHAVSVGEAHATYTLSKALKREIDGVDLVYSTTTTTGQQVARQLYGPEPVFYYPYDFSRAVRRSLDNVKPVLIVLMELEVWPNLTAEAAARGIPIVVVNGRLTERSARRYQRAWFMLGRSFRRVRRWLMQSDEYAQRVKTLGVEAGRVEVTGNVKYDAIETTLPTDAERAEARAMLAFPAEARTIVCGSTHPSEEEAVLETYRSLLGEFPLLRLVLVPRHPHRLDEVEKAVRAADLPCIRRSKVKEHGERALSEIPADKRSRTVILVDTMGELRRIYRAAEIAFVGGSLIPHGGQNVMEPSGVGLPTVYGPHMHNFKEADEILAACEGRVQVEDAGQLGEAFKRLLSDPAAAREMGSRARQAFLNRQGAVTRCAEYLRTLLP
jgi:3-deoxy-D-manno-octulosonic-acid transferase